MTQPPPKKKSLDDLLDEEFSTAPQGASSLDALLEEEFSGIPQGITEDPPRPAVVAAMEEQNKIENANKLREMAKTASPERAARMRMLADQYAPEGTIRQTIMNAKTEERLPGSNLVRGGALGAYRVLSGMADLGLGVTQAINPVDRLDDAIQGIRNNMQDSDAFVKEKIDPQGAAGFIGQFGATIASGGAWNKINVGALKGLQTALGKVDKLKPLAGWIEKLIATGTAANAPLKARMAAQAVISGAADVAQVVDILANDENYPDDAAKYKALGFTVAGSTAGAALGSTKWGQYNYNPLTGVKNVEPPKQSPMMVALSAEQEGVAAANIARAEAAAARRKDWTKSIAASWQEANPGKKWAKDATDIEKTRWMAEAFANEQPNNPIVADIMRRVQKIDALLGGGGEIETKLAKREMKAVRDLVREAALGEPQGATQAAPVGVTTPEPPPAAAVVPALEGTPSVDPSVGAPPAAVDPSIPPQLAGLATPLPEAKVVDLVTLATDIENAKPVIAARMKQQELKKIADIVDWWDELSPKKRDEALVAAGFKPAPPELRSMLTADSPPEFQQVIRAAMEAEQARNAAAAAKTAEALGRGAGKGKAAEAAALAEAKLAEENPLLHKVRATWSRAEAKKYPQMDDVTLATWLEATKWKAENSKEPALQDIYGKLAGQMQEEIEARALRNAQAAGDQPTVDAILTNRTDRAGMVDRAFAVALKGPALRFMGGYLGGALYNTLDNDSKRTPEERLALNIASGAAAAAGPAALRAMRSGASQVGLSTKDVSTDWWKGPKWYSKLERAIESSSSKVAPASDWLTYLSNPERRALRESHFTGMHLWLSEQGDVKVTREQVLAKLAENPLKVRVHWGGADGRAIEGAVTTLLERYGLPPADLERYELYQIATAVTAPGPSRWSEVAQAIQELAPRTRAALVEDLEELRRFDVGTRWAPGGSVEQMSPNGPDIISSVNLEGGEKHFEMVVEMDPASKWQLGDDSPHWPSNRVLAHLRGHYRNVTLEDGSQRRVLYVDEMQSDVAQQRQKTEPEYWEDYGVPNELYHDSSERWLHLLYASFMEHIKRSKVNEVVFSPWEVQAVRNNHLDTWAVDYRQPALNDMLTQLGVSPVRGTSNMLSLYFKDGDALYKIDITNWQRKSNAGQSRSWDFDGEPERVDMLNQRARSIAQIEIDLALKAGLDPNWTSFVHDPLNYIRPAAMPAVQPPVQNLPLEALGLRKVPSEKQAGDRKFYGQIVPQEFRKFAKKQLKVALEPEEVTLDVPNPLTGGALKATMFRVTPEALRNYDEFGVTASLHPIPTGAAVGATFGYFQDASDEEERARNMLYYGLLGTGVGAGGVLANKLLRNANKAVIAKAQPPHVQELRKIVKSAEDYEGGALSGDGLLTRLGKEWRSLYAGTVDPTRLWKDIGNVLGQQNQAFFTEGGKVAQVTSKMAEMFGLYRARAENALFGTGVVDWDVAGNRTVLYGKSLRDIVQASGTGARELGELMFALRTLELAKQTNPRNTGVSVPVAAKVVADATPEMYAAAQEARQYSLALAQMLENAGILENGTAGKFAQEDFYTPLRRILGIDPNQATGAQTGPAVQGGAGGTTVPNPVKALKGSTLPVQNPVEALLDLTQRYMRAAELNRNVGAFFKMLENAPPALRAEFLGEGKVAQRILGAQGKNVTQTNAQAQQLSAAAGVSVDQAKALVDMLDSKTLTMADGTVRYYENGKVVSYRVRDDVLKMFKYLSGDELKDFLDNTFGRLAEGAAGAAKVGITGSPLFILRQAIRDVHQYTLNGTYGVVPGWAHLKALGYQSAGWWAQVANTKEFQLYKEFGGGGDSIADNALKIVQGKVELVSKLETKGDTYGKQLLQKLKVKNLRDVREAYAMVMAPIADAGRIGAYLHERGRGADVADAVWRSKVKGANYSQRGQWAIMHALNRTTLFLNPALQSIEATKNAIKTNPLGYALHATFGISVPSALFWLAAQEDEEVRDVQESSAGARNWVFRWNEQIYLIPKPIADGQLWGTSVERALAQYFEGVPAQASQWAENVANDFAVGLLPVIGVVPVSVMTNTKWGLGGQLASPYEVPSQAAGGASEVAKMMSNFVVGERVTTGAEWLDRLVSPAGIQWTIKTFSGTFGEDALKVFDAMWKLENKVPQGVDEWPFVSAVFGKPNTGAAGSVRELFEQGDQALKAHTRWEELTVSDPVAAEAWRERYKDLIASAAVYAAGKAKVRDLRKAITDLELLPPDAVSYAEKKELTKALMEQMVLQARVFTQAARAVREGMK